MLNTYKGLTPQEKILVWVVPIAVGILIVKLVVSNAGIVAAAQIGATIGTLVIAGLAFAQIREMRETRLAQEHPQVIVDTDHSKPPLVYVVLRNIGRGAAKDISFEFSAPMEMPEGIENPLVVPVNEQPYFKHGMDYLAPGAKISCLWGSMITLANFLRDSGLDEGVTITSRYRSLTGEQHKTEWTVNPLLMAHRIFTSEVGIKELVKAIEAISNDLHKVVSPLHRKLRVSTASERQKRQNQSNGEGG